MFEVRKISIITIDPLQEQLQKPYHLRFGTVQPVVQPLKLSNGNNSSSVDRFKRNWKRKSFANFFIAWLDFSNLLLILPFRVVKNDKFYEDGRETNEGVDEYIIKKNRFQQVISGAFHISTLLICFGEFRINMVSKTSQNPVEFLTMFDRIVTLLHNFVLMYIMWRKSPMFLVAVNKLAARKSLVSDGKCEMMPPRWVAVTIMGVYAIFAFFTPLLLSDQFLTIDTQVAKFEERIKYHFFLTNVKPSKLFMEMVNATNNSTIQDDVLSSSHNIPALITFSCCFAFRSFMGSFTDALVLVTALSLWHPVKEFSQILKKTTSGKNKECNIISLRDAIKEYKELKELSIVINAAVQTVVFTFIMQAIFFYSIRLKEWMTNCGPGTPYLSFFFVSFFFMFYFAADICAQMDQFRLFVYQMEDSWVKTDTDIMILLHELSTSPIGISGKGRFIINYSFVAAMCSTLLTYFIVTVQSGK